jgi:hypothetical protein
LDDSIVYTNHNHSLDNFFDFLISWFIRQASKVFTDLYPQHSWLLHDEKRKRLDVVCRRPGGQNKVNIVYKRGENKNVEVEQTCSSNIQPAAANLPKVTEY